MLRHTISCVRFNDKYSKAMAVKLVAKNQKNLAIEECENIRDVKITTLIIVKIVIRLRLYNDTMSRLCELKC